MHELSSPRPLLCNELVDRVRELHELQAALERAAQGRPQLVLLAGEAGLGKTKLCRAFLQTGEARRALVLFGQAILQDKARPFGPFLDALRRYLTLTAVSSPHAHPSPQPPLASVLRLFPDLSAMLPGSLSPPLQSEAPVVQGQQAIFHGLLSALQELARSGPGPLLLVLEDLHWADETSLELLAFLAQRLDANATFTEPAPQPQQDSLLLLGTYRADALSDNPALGRLLTQLRAQRHAEDIQLSPLSASDHRRCVNSILGQPVPEEFASFLFAWDEGNPFFTEELLGSMAANGQLQLQAQGWLVSAGIRPQLPSSLTDAILERVARLPAPDQEVLSYAAVIGRVFDFPLLAALSGLSEHELVQVLRRAKNVQLISEVSASQLSAVGSRDQERYQFRHALTREVIYDQMLASERRLRHRAVAETLEQWMTDGPAPSTRRLVDVTRFLAEHYWLAGLPDRARPFALHEADRARRIFAFHEERHYLSLAQSSMPEDSPERLALLERMGMVSLAIFDFSKALHWLGTAKACYQRIGQTYQALQTMANMLLPAWFVASSSLTDMLAELEMATEAVFADPHHANRDSTTTLVITSLIATYRAYDCQFQRAMYWIQRSFELYESLTEPGKVAAMQLSLMSSGWIKTHHRRSVAEEGIGELRNVLRTGLKYNLPDVIVFSYAWLAFTLVLWGRGDEAERVLAESMHFEQMSGLPHPSFAEGWKYFFAGDDWGQGIEALHADIKRREQAGSPALVAIEALALVQMLLARNELDVAEMYLQRIQPVLELQDQYIYLSQMWWAFAKLSRARGNHLRAHELYERILKRWKTTEDALIIPPILLDCMMFYVDGGNLEKARRWLAELQRVMQVTDNPVGAAALLEARGALKAAEGKIKEAIPVLREAVEMWGTIHWRFHQALACQRLAEVLLGWARKQSTHRVEAQAAREEADLLLDTTLAVYEDLHIPTGIQAVQGLRSRTYLQAQHKRRQTLEARRPLESLTERERQVLLQLAAGRTNREIASALHISLGTVELHVTHILTKLGCKTRTQAAAYAISRGWVKQEKHS